MPKLCHVQSLRQQNNALSPTTSDHTTGVVCALWSQSESSWKEGLGIFFFFIYFLRLHYCGCRLSFGGTMAAPWLLYGLGAYCWPGALW